MELVLFFIFKIVEKLFKIKTRWVCKTLMFPIMVNSKDGLGNKETSLNISRGS